MPSPRQARAQSITPTFVEGPRGYMIVGSPGGSLITGMVLLATLDWMDGRTAQQIVAAPRIHHQYQPDVLAFETAALTPEERPNLCAAGTSCASARPGAICRSSRTMPRRNPSRHRIPEVSAPPDSTDGVDIRGGSEESMTNVAAPFHPTHTTGSSEDFEKRVGGAAPALALFALGCAPLLWLDRMLQEPDGSPILLMPSAGLLYIALWMSRPSRWPALVVVHMLVALAVGSALSMPHTVREILLAIVPVPVCGIFAAVTTMLLIRVPIQLAIWQVPLAIIGGALGGLAGSLVALLLRLGTGPTGPSYTFDLLSGWASLGLGAVTMGAVTLMWLLKIRVGIRNCCCARSASLQA